jgi:hypothetical protein
VAGVRQAITEGAAGAALGVVMSSPKIEIRVDGLPVFYSSPMELLITQAMERGDIKLRDGARVECLFDNGNGHLSMSAEWFGEEDDIE